MRAGERPEARGQRTRNPFASCRVRPGAIPFQFPSHVDAASLVARLQQQKWLGAIVGPHGSGKSTLLAALQPEIERAGRRAVRINLHNGQRQLSPHVLPLSTLHSPLSTHVLIIDGYEQLSYWSRLQLNWLCRRENCGLLVTSHAPTRLPTLLRTAVNLDLAERIVGHLLVASPALPAHNELDDPNDSNRYKLVDRDDVHTAFTVHHGNLREMLFDLYDLFELRCRSLPSIWAD